MTAHGLGAPARYVRSMALLLLLPLLACHPRPTAVFEAQQEHLGAPDPWFGEGVRLEPGTQVDLAWAAPGLSLSGQAVELAGWEAPAAPGPGLKAEHGWIAERDLVTRVLQTLATDSIGLAQVPKPPDGTPAAYRLEGRVLAFGREARVAAKTGQFLGNLILVPVTGLLFGGVAPGIQGISGYQTEVLFQVKVVDLRTQDTVLAVHSRKNFKSLEAPVEVAAALWKLSGGEAAAHHWWPAQELSEIDGDYVWFRPGMDMRGTRIRCLPWLPDYSRSAQVREKDIRRGLPTRMPSLLVAEAPAGQPGPVLSEGAGDLYLQGHCDAFQGRGQSLSCRVKVWDPATGEVVGLMQVTKGFWQRNIEQDWARRIVHQLVAHKPNEDQGVVSKGFWRSAIEMDWIRNRFRNPPTPAPQGNN